MPIQSKFGRTVVAIAAAVVMSSVTVSAAVGPAQASSISFSKAPIYA